MGAQPSFEYWLSVCVETVFDGVVADVTRIILRITHEHARESM